MGPIVFLLLPALCYAGITVNIKASANKNDTLVTHYGKDMNIITDIERESFNLTQHALTASTAVFSGGKPNDVFVKSPTPWGDLYKTYNWSEVRRETKVILDDTMDLRKEVTLFKANYNNNSTKTTTFTSNCKQVVKNEISNKVVGKNMSVNVNYNVELSPGLKPPLRLAYVGNLANTSRLSENRTIQPDSAVTFDLKPSQSATVFLTATKVELVVHVVYLSSVTGQVAANYNPRHKGHHFWAYDVKTILATAGQPTQHKTVERVTIQFYTGAKVVVVDNATGKVIKHESAGY